MLRRLLSGGGRKGLGAGRGAAAAGGGAFSEAEVAEARAWVKWFGAEHIPRAEFQHKFVRASGPGGQNVNKVATKSEIRFRLGEAAWLPRYVREQAAERLANRVNRRGELVVASDVHRTQAQNLEDAYTRLHGLLIGVGEPPAETTKEKVREVEGMKRRANERRLERKKANSERKRSKSSLKQQARRGGDDF